LIALSVLSVVAVALAFARRNLPRILAGAILGTAIASMSLLFTVKIERYAFVVVPLVVALGTIGAAEVVHAVRRVVARPVRPDVVRPDVVSLAAVPLVLALLLSLGAAPADYADAAARLTSTTTSYRHPDYAPAARYMLAHWRAGDAFVTLAPPDVPAYYAGRVPDRIIATGRNKLLYVIEHAGRATDTIYGTPVLLTGRDVTAYVQGQRRVWLVSDTGSALAGVPGDVRDAVGAQFRLVMQGSGATVYMAGTP
jgi:hypothetical protein